MMLNAIKVTLFGLGITLVAALHASEDGVIKGEVFVVLHQQGEQSRADASTVAQDLNLVLAPRSIPELGIYVLRGAWDQDTVLAVENHRLVQSASAHHYAYTKLPSTQNAPVARSLRVTTSNPVLPQEQIISSAAWDEGWRGRDVVIAVLDTGIDFDHPGFDGRVLEGWDFVRGRAINSASTDSNGHGTHIAGIAAASHGVRDEVQGIASDAMILPVRVLKSDLNSDIGWQDGSPVLTTIQGIHYAAQYAQDNNQNVVINASFGSPAEQNYCEAIRRATNDRVVIVAAAMNAGTDSRYYPAACEGVISVGNVDGSGVRAADSNHGDWVKIYAPGVDVLSTWRNGGYSRQSGTSMAAGFVSGAVAALLSSNSGKTPKEIADLIVANANSDDSSKERNRLDMSRAVNALLNRPLPPILRPNPPSNVNIQISN